MKQIALSLALLASLGSLGCVGDADESSDSSDAKAVAVLSFGADWSVEQSAPLVEGRKVRIEYDEERLPDCRGEMNGNPAWSITAYSSINEAEPETTLVAGFSPTGQDPDPVIDLEEAGDLAIWFSVHNRWGCIEYDSDFGNNFNFVVEPAE